MLYLYEPQQFEDVHGNPVTVYPDSHEDNVFYPIPPLPRFRRDENDDPVFRLIKFRGGEDSTAPRVELPTETGGENDEIPANSVPTLDGEVAGGFLIFDTEFSLDQESLEEIRVELDEQVRSRYLAENREVPQGFQIVLRQPQWTDGTVEILMEDTNRGWFESVSKTGKPSLMGNNVSSLAAVLRPWQATLVEEAITSEGFSPIQVSYNLKFLAKLPPVRISICASAYDSYRMYKEYETYRTGCGGKNRHTIITGITERVVSRDVVNISIDSGGLTIDDETFKHLQEFAMGLVQQWIQQEFLKPPPERATEDQLKSIDLKRLTESDFRDLNIKIEQSATVEVPIYPQGTLEALVEEGVDLSQFIIEVDLDADPFYQNREASVKVYADFPDPAAEPQPSDLLFVEVTVRYGDEAETMTWDAQGSDTTTANGGRWKVSWHKIPDVNEIEWEARVVFREPDREYTLGPETTDKTEINIPVPLPGRARLQLVQSGVPWEIVQHIEATVEYRDSAADPQVLTKRLLFTQESDEVVMDEVIWTRRKEPFFVELEYRLKNDNVIHEEPIREESDLFIVDSPFKEWITIPIRARWTGEEWESDIVNLKYRDDDNGYVREGEIHLSEEGGWGQLWTIPLLDPAKDTYQVKWLRRCKEGGMFTSADVPGNPADGWLVRRGSEVIYSGHPDACDAGGGDMLRVYVDPLIFLVGVGDDKEVVRAIVHLSRAESTDVDDHVFTPADTEAWVWREFVRDPDNKTYEWWAEYYTKPYSKIEIGPFESVEETVVLTPLEE